MITDASTSQERLEQSLCLLESVGPQWAEYARVLRITFERLNTIPTKSGELVDMGATVDDILEMVRRESTRAAQPLREYLALHPHSEHNLYH